AECVQVRLSKCEQIQPILTGPRGDSGSRASTRANRSTRQFCPVLPNAGARAVCTRNNREWAASSGADDASELPVAQDGPRQNVRFGQTRKLPNEGRYEIMLAIKV